MSDPLRHHKHNHLHPVFGDDKFGVLAERFARFFGTPKFIIVQTCIVVLWIVLNACFVAFQWDPFPYILLNLVFSTQSAYAAPLILLAQTRQADRDKASEEASAKHLEEVTQLHTDLLRINTTITENIEKLSQDVHQHILKDAGQNS